MKSFVAFGLAALVGASVGAGQAPPQSAPFDLVITGGHIVDGSGAPWMSGDMGVTGDRIVRVGNLSGVTAKRRIDATGLIVAPGFIDPHAHARERLFELPTAEGYLLQGLTTVVDGNDGSSPLPLGPYFAKAEAAHFTPNLALFVGHGTVREAVMGTANRYATPDELTKMKALVATAMDEGALGLSTGLAYVPGTYSKPEGMIPRAALDPARGAYNVSHGRRQRGGDVLGRGAFDAAVAAEERDLLRAGVVPADDVRRSAVGVPQLDDAAHALVPRSPGGDEHPISHGSLHGDLPSSAGRA